MSGLHAPRDPITGARRCYECDERTARYEADLGASAPSFPGLSYLLCDPCAAELRAENMIEAIRTLSRPGVSS